MTQEEVIERLHRMIEAMAYKAGAEVYLTARDKCPPGEEREYLTAQALKWNHWGQAALGDSP